MTGYSASDVARMLDLSPGQVRSWARAGFIQVRRGIRGEYRFTFQDLVLLRAAKGLVAARIPGRKIRLALKRLRDQLPSGRALTELTIAADGDRIVVRDGKTLFRPESGQTVFDFEVGDLAEKVAPLARRAAKEAFASPGQFTAEDWFELGLELEASDLEKAREAYYRALAVDPASADAHVNLGRLMHEAREAGAAEAHYRLALAARPGDPTALFNLAVALEDMNRRDEAIAVYCDAIRSDPEYADAYFNIARLYEQGGESAKALQHLNTYRRLTRR